MKTEGRASLRGSVSQAAGGGVGAALNPNLSLRRKIYDIGMMSDNFPYEVSPDPVSSTSTPLSLLGTLFAMTVLIAMSVGLIGEFRNRKVIISRSSNPRPPELTASLSPFGILINRGGRPFYNESFFRFRFRYRAIFHGDSQNDVTPRQYHTLPSMTCKLYYDLSSVTDKSKILSDVDSGKTAEMGCIDDEGARALLRTAGVEPAELTLQGMYGEPAYWFVQADLLPCNPDKGGYGDGVNITCASKSEVDEFFETGVAFDAVSLDSLSPRTALWSNLYVTFDKTSYKAAEMFYRAVKYTIASDTFPSIWDGTETDHLSFSSQYFRDRSRKPTDAYFSVYFRISDIYEEVEESPFSLEGVFEGIGAWHGFLWTFVGLFCMQFNRIYHIIVTVCCNRQSQGDVEAGDFRTSVISAVSVDDAHVPQFDGNARENTETSI